MKVLTELFDEYKDSSDARLAAFATHRIRNLDSIQDDAYLESSTWLESFKDVVCVVIDLEKSSIHSMQRKGKTMARIYDYFTQNVVDFFRLSGVEADYIDIKGDGAFAIYNGTDKLNKAFVAGMTFKTFFSNKVKPKLESEIKGLNIHCRVSIDIGGILVKKVGTRIYNNEVWAGRVVNSAMKIMSLNDDIKKVDEEAARGELYLVSEQVYTMLKGNYNDYVILSCGCIGGKKVENSEKKVLWKKYDIKSENIQGSSIHYTTSDWCKNCGDDYIKKILK